MLNYQRVNDLQSGFLVWRLLVTCPACDFATVRCGDCAFQILVWPTSCLLEIWSPVSIWSAKTPKSFVGWGWPVTIYCIAMFVDCHVCWPIGFDDLLQLHSSMPGTIAAWKGNALCMQRTTWCNLLDTIPHRVIVTVIKHHDYKQMRKSLEILCCRSQDCSKKQLCQLPELSRYWYVFQQDMPSQSHYKLHAMKNSVSWDSTRERMQ